MLLLNGNFDGKSTKTRQVLQRGPNITLKQTVMTLWMRMKSMQTWLHYQLPQDAGTLWQKQQANRSTCKIDTLI
jgi:hypothetical protein